MVFNLTRTTQVTWLEGGGGACSRSKYLQTLLKSLILNPIGLYTDTVEQISIRQ